VAAAGRRKAHDQLSAVALPFADDPLQIDRHRRLRTRRGIVFGIEQLLEKAALAAHRHGFGFVGTLWRRPFTPVLLQQEL
jgi:hypothetical protein